MRISLTDRCNMRCTYCMPEAGSTYGPRSELLSLEEIVAACTAFVQWGVRRVRLTGGEPTLRRGLPELVAELRSISLPEGGHLEVVMTTNGERLTELARPLREAGLGGLTVSLDSLSAERFARITRRGSLERVLAGLEAASEAGFGAIKLNTVAIRGFNDDEFSAIAAFAWARGYIPRYIEMMPMASGELYVPGELMPAAELRARISATFGAELAPDDGAGVRGSGPAQYFRMTAGRYAGSRLGTI